MTQTPSTILTRLAEKDASAVNDCLDKYGNLVWALAKKYTTSQIEAEMAAQKIFQDIWQCQDNLDLSKNSELKCVLYVVFRNLFGHFDSFPEKNNLAFNPNFADGWQNFSDLKKSMIFQNPKL